MKKEEFYYDSRDGRTKLHAVRWIPDGEPVCIVQIVHGMAEYIDRYDRLARALTAEGFLVAGEDHLGHGKSLYGEVPDAGQPLGYFCDHDAATVVVRDVHRLKKINQEKYPGLPYIIVGHSMGSFILRNYLCRYSAGIDGAIIMGTGMQKRPVVKFAKGLAAFLSVVQGKTHKSRLMDVLAFGAYNKKIHRPVSRMDWLSNDASEVQKYLEDPLCGFTFTLNGFSTLFELIDRLYDEKSLEKMRRELPVLFLAGEEDPVGDYGAAVQKTDESFRRMGMKYVECRLYPGMRHELVNDENRETVTQDIVTWIKKTVLGEARD